MNVSSSLWSNNNCCVNCSAIYEDLGVRGRKTKVEEIFLAEKDKFYDNPFQTEPNEVNERLHVTPYKVGSILSRIFRLDYIPEGGDEEEDVPFKRSTEELSVCWKCSDGLRELWRVYNEFIRLGEAGSYLSRRIARLDEIIQKQGKPSFIQLRRDIFDDDDSGSTNPESEEVVSITPVSEPRRRGKIPVKVQALPEQSLLRVEESRLPSPISDLIVCERDESFEDEELWGRLRVTPEIHCEQTEGVEEKFSLLPVTAGLREEMSGNEINGLNPTDTCRAVSYSLFSSYRPVPQLELSSLPQPVQASGNKSKSNSNCSSKSNRRKSSVITRECTDLIEFVPGTQQQLDKSLPLFSPPSPTQPRILSRKRKLQGKTTPPESNQLSTFEILGTLESVQVMQSPDSTEQITPPPAKLPKVIAPKKSKKAKGRKKGTKKRKKAKKTKVVSKSGTNAVPSEPSPVEAEPGTSSKDKEANYNDLETGTGEAPVEIAPSSVSVHESTEPSTSLESALNPIPALEPEAPVVRRSKKEASSKKSKSKSSIPAFRIFKAVSKPNGNGDGTIPTIKIFKTVPKAKGQRNERVDEIFQSSSHTKASGKEKVSPFFEKPKDLEFDSTSVGVEAEKNTPVNPVEPNHVDKPNEIFDSAIQSQDILKIVKSPLKIKKKCSKSEEIKDLVSSVETASTKNSKKKKKKRKESPLSDGNLHKRYRLRKLKVPYPCWYCSMDFRTAPDVIEHTKKEHGVSPKSILCLQCAKICNSPQSYKYHAKTCIPPKKPAKGATAPLPVTNYKDKCPICLKFFLKKSIPAHLKVTHSNERPFLCDACDYKAKTPYRLKIHRMKVHKISSTKGAKIDATPETAKAPPPEENPDLLSTVKLEAPATNGGTAPGKKCTKPPQERPFPCDVCSYRGLTDIGLQAHKKKNHQLVKCPECERMFVDKYILQEHMRTNHHLQGVTYRKKLRARIPDWVVRSKESESTEGSNIPQITETILATLIPKNIKNAAICEVPVNLSNSVTPKNATTAGNSAVFVPYENSRTSDEAINVAACGDPVALPIPGAAELVMTNPGDSEIRISHSTENSVEDFENPEASVTEPMDLSTPNHHSREQYHPPCRIPEQKKQADPKPKSKAKVYPKPILKLEKGSKTKSISKEKSKFKSIEEPKSIPKSRRDPNTKAVGDSNTKSVGDPNSKSTDDPNTHAKSTDDPKPSPKTVEDPHRKLNSPEESEDPPQKKFLCKDCNTSFSSKYRLIKHKMVEHGFTKTAKFFCDRCGKGFFTEDSRRVHQDTIHGLQKAFVCQFCGKEFVKTSTMKNHMIHIHPHEANPYSCSKCGVSFDDVTNLRDHAYTCESGESQPVGSAIVSDSTNNNNVVAIT